MIVKTYDGLAGTENETELKGGVALTRRFLLEEDGVGFTLSDIRFGPADGTQLWYKNHIEANYVIEGEGILEELGLETHDRLVVVNKMDQASRPMVSALKRVTRGVAVSALQKEGFDVTKISDPLFLRDDEAGAYVALTKKLQIGRASCRERV